MEWMTTNNNRVQCCNHETFCGWLRHPAPGSYESDSEGNYEGNYMNHWDNNAILMGSNTFNIWPSLKIRPGSIG